MWAGLAVTGYPAANTMTARDTLKDGGQPETADGGISDPVGSQSYTWSAPIKSGVRFDDKGAESTEEYEAARMACEAVVQTVHSGERAKQSRAAGENCGLMPRLLNHKRAISTARQWHTSVLVLALAVLSISCSTSLRTVSGYGHRTGTIEFEEQSQFSHIRVRRRGSIASLNFVRDDGRETVQSIMNLSKPHDLLAPYSRYMFASYLFKRQQRRVLIVGLGAGSMVRYLQHYVPQLRIDAVEIDPLIVEIANRYFGTRSDANTNIIVADGFEYLQKTETRYDVIYMDVFLKPAAGTDNMGTPLRLKTIRFYEDLQEQLTPDGLVVFNVFPHPEVEQDIRVIRDAFANIYTFKVGNTNLVVVASKEPTRLTPSALQQRAVDADRGGNRSVSFQDMLSQLRTE